MGDKDIKIRNRYGYDHTLVFVDENKYRLVPDSYMRLIYSDNECKNIENVDPDGGPFMGRGTIINDLKVIDIQQEENGIFLYTQPGEND
jgi:hypothetical protein